MEHRPGVGAEFWQETAALTRRWVIRARRTPAELVFGLLQPLIWLLLFGNMFSQVSSWRPDVFGTSSYLTFQVAGILVMTVFGFLVTGGVPLLFDRETGFLSRLLAAPISRASIIVSRFLFLSAYGLVQCALILVVSLAMGAQVQAGPAQAAVVLLICMLLGIGLATVSIGCAFLFPSHQVYFSVMGFATTPALFTSSALMPLKVMPRWLAALAQLNPLTHACEAIRPLILGEARAAALVMPVVWLVAFDLLALAWASWIMGARSWTSSPRAGRQG